MSKKPNDRLTILILPQGEGAPRRLEIRRSTITRVAMAAGLAALGFGVGVLDYVSARMELAVAERQTGDLKKQVRRERQGVEERQRQLAVLRDEVMKLRRAVTATAGLERDIRREQGIAAYGEPLIATGGVDAKLPLDDSFETHDIVRMRQAMAAIARDSEENFAGLTKLRRYFRSRRGEIADRPSMWPVRGWVTSEFGVRSSPFTGEIGMHEGLDIAAPIGTVINAPAAGRAIFVGHHPGFGNYIVVDHGGGVTTHYGHLAQTLATEGAPVERGTPLGLVGSTGRSTGPHLHYEVRVMDIPVNPHGYLPAYLAEIAPASPQGP
ncbi:peptidoglycan DD-metalloendopeptidase family protein [bacterium]|nr:peptidoglycan DD-metalloendopeptidase family protein [bacterium]